MAFEKKIIDWQRILFKDGKAFNGIYKDSYKFDNDFLTSEENYIDGILNGVSKIYYSNGNLRSIQNYKNGKEIGIAKTYHKNGLLCSEINYGDGEADFKDWKEYYENGLLKFDVDNSEGNMKWKEYYNNGNLACEHIFDNGKRVKIIVYYENGKIKSEESYENNEKNGIAKYYEENGELACILTYQNGAVKKREDIPKKKDVILKGDILFIMVTIDDFSINLKGSKELEYDKEFLDNKANEAFQIEKELIKYYMKSYEGQDETELYLENKDEIDKKYQELLNIREELYNMNIFSK